MLVGFEVVGEVGQDVFCKRDVVGFDVDVGGSGKGFDDGEE